MVHIEDGNPAHLEKNNGQKINMQRLDILGEQLLWVKNFQKKSYRFQTDSKVIFYLANLQGLGDEDLYQFSLKLQPTQAQLEEQREKKGREKEQSSARRVNSPRRSIVGALSAISPRAWAQSPRERDAHFSDHEVEDSAIESDMGTKRRDVTAKKKFLPLFRNKSSQHIKEDSWIAELPHHEEERDRKDEDEEEEESKPWRPPVPPRTGLSKSSGNFANKSVGKSPWKLRDPFSSKGELWKGGRNMEEAPPGYNKPRGLFLIGAGGRRRVGEQPARLRRSSSVDSFLPKPPAEWIASGSSSPKAKPPPPADWILGGGYSPRKSSPKGSKTDNEEQESGKKSTFKLFRNLSSVISRPPDDWELSVEEKERATSYRKQRGKHSEEAKKARDRKRRKKKERKKMKKHLRETSAPPSREPSPERSLSPRSRSSSNTSEGMEGKGKGSIEKFLRRAVSFVNGPNMSEEEMIVRESGAESLFTAETDIVQAESFRIPLSEWYDGIDEVAVEEEKPKKKGLTRHPSLVRVRNLLKK